MKKHKLLKRIEAAKRKIAEGRDELRAAVGDATEVLECVDRAETGLDDAIDALSEYV